MFSQWASKSNLFRQRIWTLSCLHTKSLPVLYFTTFLLSQAVLGTKKRRRKKSCIVDNKERKMEATKKDQLFHIIHKVPSGDSPYVRAKYFQLVEKDFEASILWFWKAIKSNDRVDSALKDMSVVMKQQNRSEEAIEAIKSFRHLCSKQAQESLDNLLIDLYKKCNLVEEQIQLLKAKLKAIYMGKAFNGKITKTARSHGKKFQVSIKQETSRILGNLGWAYMQQGNYDAAEMVYKKAQLVEPDGNKACNLGICFMRKGKFDDARRILGDVLGRRFEGLELEEGNKNVARAQELIREMEELGARRKSGVCEVEFGAMDLDFERLDVNEWANRRRGRLPIFEEISPFRHQMAC